MLLPILNWLGYLSIATHCRPWKPKCGGSSPNDWIFVQPCKQRRTNPEWLLIPSGRLKNLFPVKSKWKRNGKLPKSMEMSLSDKFLWLRFSHCNELKWEIVAGSKVEEHTLLGETHPEKDGNKDLVVNSSLHPANNRSSRFFKSPMEIGNCLIADLLARSFLKASNLPKCSGNLLSVVYMAHNIQVRELIRSVAEWKEPSRTEWSGTPD